MENKFLDENKEKTSQTQAAETAFKRNLSLLKVSFNDLSIFFFTFAKNILSEFHNFDVYNLFAVINTMSEVPSFLNPCSLDKLHVESHFF